MEKPITSFNGTLVVPNKLEEYEVKLYLLRVLVKNSYNQNASFTSSFTPYVVVSLEARLHFCNGNNKEEFYKMANNTNQLDLISLENELGIKKKKTSKNKKSNLKIQLFY